MKKLIALFAILMGGTSITLSADQPSSTRLYFPQEEYEHYMGIIKGIDRDLHTWLREYEEKFSQHGFSEGKINFIKAQPDGYPHVTIPSVFKGDEATKKDFFTLFSNGYRTLIFLKQNSLSLKKRLQILQIIQSISPSLYKQLIAIDPQGNTYIKETKSGSNNAFVCASSSNGLPIITLGTKTLNLPDNQLRFVIAHELSHYVLKHPRSTTTIAHPLLTDAAELQKITTQDKNLPFEKTFRFAQGRIREFEADRFAIMHFGCDIDAAISYFKKPVKWQIWKERLTSWFSKNSGRNPKNETFKSTHPLWQQRITHLESLRREVQWQKNRNEHPKEIDWESLRQHYLDDTKK